MFEGGCRVIGGVDWFDFRLAALQAAAVQLHHFHFLDVAGIGQHDAAEIGRGMGAVDALVVAMLHQFRQKP